jgi:hypothetical protein
MMLASGTYDPPENCEAIQLYAYAHAGALDFLGPRLHQSCVSQRRNFGVISGDHPRERRPPRGPFADYVRPAHALSSAAPRPGAGSKGTAPASRAPRVAPSHLKLGPKRRHVFARLLEIYEIELCSGPFLGGDEVNIQRAPSHPTRISTAIRAV